MKLPRISGSEIDVAFNEAMGRIEDALKDILHWTDEQRKFNDSISKKLLLIEKNLKRK